MRKPPCCEYVQTYVWMPGIDLTGIGIAERHNNGFRSRSLHHLGKQLHGSRVHAGRAHPRDLAWCVWDWKLTRQRRSTLPGIAHRSHRAVEDIT